METLVATLTILFWTSVVLFYGLLAYTLTKKTNK